MKNKIVMSDDLASVVHMLHRASQRADDLFLSHVGDGGLRPRQFAVLLALMTRETASQTDLVEITGVDRSTLADIVRRLVERGLLKRQRTKEDRRAYAVRLTPAGTAAIKATRLAARLANDELLRGLSTAERQRMDDFLGRLVTGTPSPLAKGKPAKSARVTRLRAAA